MSRYTHAIVTRLPNAFAAEAGGGPKLNLQNAKREQEEFCENLREAGVDVFELAPEDCGSVATLFVDDLAVVCNGTALMTVTGHTSRKLEVMSILAELGFYIVDLANHPDCAKILLEGSDVLFTGREFFVGLSKRTNVAGAMEVARAFPEFPVIPVKVGASHRLKEFVCLAGPNILSVGESKDAQTILKRIEREATFRYHTMTFSEEAAINCVNINGNLLYRPEFRGAEKFGTLQDTKLCPIQFSELSKLGGISKHCLLIRRIKLLKSL